MTEAVNRPARILGVDVGGVRTGLALSDPLRITCSPLTVLVERDEERLIEKILHIAEAEGVSEIVIGLPRPLGGGSNAHLRGVERFAAALAEGTSLPVKTWDERFTSKLAERDRKGRTPADAVAACHLLQSYLDASRNARADRSAHGEEGP